ncbi:4-(cytidine 5'-diphospho)-2-C-methyl-D-erythritol kinase [Chlorobium sp. N1]|uniref:4-(cytidine 5'-diphospho)-2-C-methyl-D-erythritol kinase n=1 Tax=Chlorobium sp. N1 TaxID=2491138 RepID=UPI00103BDCA1|nr:4-(cytidine 5'-diphospho)-2-C-methyl-D-erythritol kinase [Chlorobium sp. N1]TCD48654.1 4-(cytidine 5'-diphospho)-2-C-methyl-D-erythritol kinase [Chlorobium sp. N1]
MNPISVNAFAKINLGLFITGKRQDGYHTLETIFAPVSWHDTLRFSPADTISMRCTNADLPTDDSNLCIRAARSLQAHASLSAGVSIELDKRVPFGAGLGGGSSDAAAVLRVLNRFWNINAPLEELHPLAVKLGADVPYFFEMEGLAYAGGIGDELTDLDSALPWYVVTVFPSEHISTAWAYGNFHRRFGIERPDIKTLAAGLSATHETERLALFENDFESAVFEQFPMVAEVKRLMLNAGAVFSSLSGSGSAVYALFGREDEALQALSSLPDAYPSNITPPGFTMRQP